MDQLFVFVRHAAIIKLVLVSSCFSNSKGVGLYERTEFLKFYTIFLNVNYRKTSFHIKTSLMKDPIYNQIWPHIMGFLRVAHNCYGFQSFLQTFSCKLLLTLGFLKRYM